MADNFNKNWQDKILESIFLPLLLIFVIGGFLFYLRNKPNIEKAKKAPPYYLVTQTTLPQPSENLSNIVLKKRPFFENLGANYQIKEREKEAEVTAISKEFKIQNLVFKGYQIQFSNETYFLFWNFFDPSFSFAFKEDKNGQIECQSREIFNTFPFNAFDFSFQKEEFVIPQEYQFLGEEKYSVGENLILMKKFKDRNSEKEIWLSEQVPFYLVALKSSSYEILFKEFFQASSKEIKIEKIINCLNQQNCLACQNIIKVFCRDSSDCLCGQDLQTKECQVGNKNFIKENENCKEICKEIEVVCENNVCEATFLSF